MLQISNKSLFDIPYADLLVNTVNCQGAMGAGIAKAIADTYPSVLAPYRKACGLNLNCDGSPFRAFSARKDAKLPRCLSHDPSHQTCRVHRIRPGTLQALRVQPTKAQPSACTIINLPTKILWADGSDLDLVEQSIIALADGLRRNASAYRVVAMPPPGCGNGGLNWNRNVKPILLDHLDDLPQEILVCLNR